MLSRRAFWPALWICLGLFLVVRTGVRDRGVISDHLEFGRRTVAAEDIYAPHLDGNRPLHPVYPPSFGLLTWPLTLIPERAARFAWGLLQVIALAAIGWCLSRWLLDAHPELQPRLQPILLLTALLASRYVLRDTHGGGGNLINLALALGALDRAARGQPVIAAALLGISLATKPTTALLVPVMWLSGYRRAASGSLLAAAALVGLALLLNRHGLDPLSRWVQGSIAYAGMSNLFAEPEYGFPPFTWMNQCLRCAVARYLGVVPESFAAQVPGFFQGAGLTFAATAWISRALGLAIVGATLFAARCGRGSVGGRQTAVAMTFAAALLLSPISWKAHHVALIPAFFLIVVHGFRGHRSAFVLCAAYFLLCVVGGGDLVGRDFKNLEQSLYLATFGTLAIWSYVAGMGFRRIARRWDLPVASSACRTSARARSSTRSR